jgi:hypothetical protein
LAELPTNIRYDSLDHECIPMLLLNRIKAIPFAALLLCGIPFACAADLTATTDATPVNAPFSAPTLASLPPATLTDSSFGPNDLALDGLTVDETDLWVRIRKGFAIPDLDNQLVVTQTAWYAARPDYIQRTTTRASRYLYHVVEELEKRHMPTELALLPFIESAFNPEALSSAKAAGMWQFIPSTGLNFNLKQNMFKDDRRDTICSVTGNWRWQRITGAKDRCSARSTRIAQQVYRPTSTACLPACRWKRAIMCRSCKR